MMDREKKDSGIDIIGMVPNGWDTIRLKYLADIETGSQDTQDAVEDGEFPFFVRSPVVERIDKYVFNGEAILMAGDGVGAGKVFHYVNGKFGCHQRVYIIHSFKNIFGKFLFYYIKNLFSVEIDKGSAKSTVDSIRLPMLQNFVICTPSTFEQKKIINYLDKKCAEVDSLLLNIQSQISTLEIYKKSIITEVVTKGLNPNVAMKDSGSEWIGEIPEHWEKISLKNISTKPISYGVIKLYEPDENGVKILRCSDVKDGYIIEDSIRTITKKLSNEYSRTILKPGDVVINVRGTLGGCAVVPEKMNGYNIAREIALIAVDRKKYSSTYIMYCLLSKSFENFRDYSLSGCIYLGINMDTLSKYVCPLPLLNEQKEIVTYLDEKCFEIDELIVKKREQIDVLEYYRKSFIYEYVTGKREVPDNDEF